jgi:hypothetical protein
MKKAIKGGRAGCSHCGYTENKLLMNTKIIAGFGEATIKKNREVIYREEPNTKWENAPTLMKFELLARKTPKADWRYILNLPLRSAEYQRQGKNNWVLIKKGMGFA